jgi:hypothetical protein
MRGSCPFHKSEKIKMANPMRGPFKHLLSHFG